MKTLTVTIQPIGKPRMTQRDRWAKRKCVVDYFAFADRLRAVATEQEFSLGESFNVLFELPMPKSWSERKRNAMRGRPHQQKPDLSNLLKAIEDALMQNDERIHTVRAKKIWSGIPQIIINNNTETE